LQWDARRAEILVMLGTLVKLALAAAVVGVVGLAMFRPAAIFGVDATALANSVGGEVQHSKADCVSVGVGVWRCELKSGYVSGLQYLVRTHRFGCWTGSALGHPTAAQHAQRSVSGCIGLTDKFGH
jgi:hypothetical protein